MDLTIGQVPTELEKIVAAELNRRGVRASQTWRNAKTSETPITLLNLATVCLFLDHVARLEGFKDSAEALKGTRFKNLPWWELGVWLPIDVAPTTSLAENNFDWPVFIGSCTGLLAELDEIKSMSDFDLGAIPDGYEWMRRDFRAFCRSDFELSGGDKPIAQWVWRGLHDGAESALRQSAPLHTM